MKNETKQRLKEIQERLDAATKGEWTIEPRHVKYYDYGPDDRMTGTLRTLTNELCCQTEGYLNDWSLGADLIGPEEPNRGTFVVRDAWYIANSKADIKFLLHLITEISGGIVLRPTISEEDV